MSTNVIFMGWNRSGAGREAQTAQLSQECVQYIGGLQQAGMIQ